MGLAIVTGATGGLGLEVAVGLARAGHQVLLTGRDQARAAPALARVERAGAARFALLDVASLASVAAFADTIQEPVAILVNNAGVMALPTRETTEDGFERQFGTNHLGHVALTIRLLQHLRGGRVVPVSSVAHRRGRIAFDDLQSLRAYDPWRAYAQSKLANLMFALELQRRSDAQGWGVGAAAAHPGWAATRIILNGPGAKRPSLRARLLQHAFNAAGQSAEQGARPILHAALDPAPAPYTGPCCLMETRGHPTPARISPQATNTTDAAHLWDESVKALSTWESLG